MKLFQFLEEKIKQVKNIKQFQLKMTNTNAELNDTIRKSSISLNDFKEILTKELLGRTDNDFEELNNAFIEVSFTVNTFEINVSFTSKLDNNEISTVIVKIEINKEQQKFEDIKNFFKSKEIYIKTTKIEDMVNFLFNMLNYETPVPVADNSSSEEKPKEETKTEEKPKEETKTEEKPKEETKTEEKPKEETKTDASLDTLDGLG